MAAMIKVTGPLFLQRRKRLQDITWGLSGARERWSQTRGAGPGRWGDRHSGDSRLGGSMIARALPDNAY